MAIDPDKIQNVRDINAEIQRQIDGLKGISNLEERRMLANEQIANYQKVITELQKDQIDNTTNNRAEIVQLQAEQKKVIDQLESENKKLETQNKWRRRSVNLARELTTQLKAGWQYLQEQDKIIKTTNLNLGLSANKAVAMRNAFEESAAYVTRLGGSIGDIKSIMEGYADETGRARVMSAQMVQDIATIGKGIGLGVENATKLGAQFEMMGYDARGTMEYVQGVVDTSERMGVNTTKVLKVVNDNFKKLNTYTFRQGVRGFAEMAMYAEKFKIDINQALNAADVARSLEGAVDLAAQLQVMGGEFAKTDPFEMLFLSRNDPAKFTEKIADMTKGVVTFRKMADGSFEKFISPADRDRMANVAKSLNMEVGELTQIAERQAEIQKMRQQMGGLGLSKEQKEIIEGAAIFNQKSGKFQVEVAGTLQSIGTLTKTQAETFKIEQVLLEKRAKEAQTFNDVFNATIESLKSSLLPILKGVNKILVPVAKYATQLTTWASEGTSWLRAGAVLLSAALAWKGVQGLFSVGSTVGRNVGGRVGSKYAASRMGQSSIGSLATRGGGAATSTATGVASKGGAMKGFGAGAGMGVAMVGAGAGIMLAAKGISQLADSMSKLTPEQGENLAKVVKSLSWFMVGAAAAAVGVAALGGTATAAAPGLLAFGAAVLMAGAGIGLATLGISKMGEGLAEMNESGGGAGKELIGVAGGIGAVTLAMGSGGLISLFAFNRTLKSISKNSSGVADVGNAFASINQVLSGSKEDFIAVDNAIKSIASSNIKGGGMIAQLGTLLKKPLKVEFSKGEIAMTNDITLNISGEKFMRKVYDPKLAVQMHQSLREGKGV